MLTRLKDALDHIAAAIIKQRDLLDRLDSIGDSDHGTNMARGFTAAVEALDALEDLSTKTVFTVVGTAFSENIGGASGPLYATGFLRVAALCDDNTAFNVKNVEKLLGAAIDGIKKRGHSDAGEKTLLDVLIPVYECFTPEKAGDKTLYKCIEAAVKAAKDGLDYTKTIPATKGRASYIGERSVGHEDPGAMSSLIMVRELFNFLKY
ncbi:dihydroxyacetone kinase subunit DhaL [Pectinatus haikarae]|uniref:Dihydroxyacetone kinase-like protein n=1 Tax=Pectinatus haikarae TaxID=349096 RepID=A0ABT9Y6H3_9FIRM|nr:dihydroxyacetone kinase subunit DhaL [Pectinatus haikarae]MDQ0203425.1 dihydroxyacetone kinase-like protein [Pectinatus haikarae]